MYVPCLNFKPCRVAILEGPRVAVRIPVQHHVILVLKFSMR